MKRILAGAAFALAAALQLIPMPAHADSGWEIDSFDSKLTVAENGTVLVREEIDADFFAQKHGIFRDIPYQYVGADGSDTYLTIALKSVTADGAAVNYDTHYSDGLFDIKIGDPDVTISGQHKYVITYEVTGALLPYQTYDELYWNVTGSEWGVPIKKATASVTLAKGAVERAACYQGAKGSTEACAPSSEEVVARFAATRPLSAGEQLTVAVGYTKGAVPLLKGEAPANPFDRDLTGSEQAACAIALLGGVAAAAYLILSRLRSLGDINQSAITVVPLYDPPAGMRPGQMGALIAEGAQTQHVTATIIDLAVRGFLTIKEIPKKGIFGAADYELVRNDIDKGSLLPYEHELLEGLFGVKNQVFLSDLQNTFYKTLAEVKRQIDGDAASRGYFTVAPVAAKSKAALSAVGYIVGAAILTTGGVFLAGNPAYMGYGIAVVILGTLGAIASVVLLLLSRKAPRRTEEGRRRYAEALGYKEYLTKVEKYRQPFFERQNIFMDVLPYAILFGVTKKLANAFKNIGAVPPQPTWYVGNGPFNAFIFASNVDTFSRSFAMAAASTPSSSGSGGGGSPAAGSGAGEAARGKRPPFG